MPNITGHTELVGLMAYPIRHTQSPTTHKMTSFSLLSKLITIL